MFKDGKSVILIILTIGLSLHLPAQNYFDSLSIALTRLSDKEKIEAISAIPFDKMNSNTAAAIKLYQQATTIAKTNHSEYLGNIYEQMALAHYYGGEYDLSVESSLKAIAQYEEQNNQLKMGAVYANMGYQMKRRNLLKAFGYMRKGIQILEKAGDKPTINPAYNNFGVLHEMDGNIDSALYYYNKSLEIVTELKDSLGLPYTLNNIAGAYVIQGDFEKALPYYNEAYKIRQQRKDVNGLAENETYFGDFYFKQEKYQQAIPYYQKAFQLCQQINYTYLQKVNAEQLAKSYSSTNQHDSSLVYYKKTVELNDILLNESTFKTINNLEIQFETEKKEKQIAEQEAEIAQQEFEIKQRTYLLYSVVGVGILVLVIGFFVIRQIRFKQQQLLAENKLKDEITKVKVLTKLNEERLRIAKDLHDNIGAQLTFIISSIDNMMYVIDDKQEQLKTKLNELNEFSKAAIKELRVTINQLNKK